jgi:hypothetical protein
VPHPRRLLSSPETILSSLEDIETVRKYLIKSDLIDNMKTALSSIENKVYGVQQNVKKQQLTLMDM